GRGLDHLFSRDETQISAEEKKNEVLLVKIDRIKANIHQPRKKFNDESLKELSVSIKNQGVVQPLIVRKLEKDGDYEIVAGERRYRAAKLVGMGELPVIVRDYNNIEAMTIALVENLQREDLNSIDEAKALNELKNAHNLSQEELAEKIGKSRSNVANTLRLLALPEYIKTMIAEDTIKAGHGRALLSVTNQKDQEILSKKIVEKQLSVRETETILEYWKKFGTLPKELSEREADNIVKPTIQKQFLPEKLQHIDNKLKDIFHKKAFIKGTEDKGSIKIQYKNKDELLYILSVFSIDSKEIK
ncbi:MAG: ParB/RepB/Spo0J family partition protein, partial [Mailhella sp.]|nr:ParB/RepB/Spo0J family partition protein [Mailhella sp.]